MLIKRQCEVCSAEFEATRANARYCCPGHRNKAYRTRRALHSSTGSEAGSAGTSESSQDVGGLPVHAALLAELSSSKQDGTAMGRALLAVARRIDRSTTETGPGLSSLVLRLGVELRHMETKQVPEGVEDEVAKARDKRDRKRGAH